MVCSSCKNGLEAVSGDQMICRVCGQSYYMYKGELVATSLEEITRGTLKQLMKKTFPVIDSAICSRCYRCLDICPTGSLQVRNGMPRVMKSCNRCLRCIEECRDKAIKL